MPLMTVASASRCALATAISAPTWPSGCAARARSRRVPIGGPRPGQVRRLGEGPAQGDERKMIGFSLAGHAPISPLGRARKNQPKPQKRPTFARAAPPDFRAEQGNLPRIGPPWGEKIIGASPSAPARPADEPSGAKPAPWYSAHRPVRQGGSTQSEVSR
jgi:hypothetical protein